MTSTLSEGEVEELRLEDSGAGYLADRVPLVVMAKLQAGQEKGPKGCFLKEVESTVTPGYQRVTEMGHSAKPVMAASLIRRKWIERLGMIVGGEHLATRARGMLQSLVVIQLPTSMPRETRIFRGDFPERFVPTTSRCSRKSHVTAVSSNVQLKAPPDDEVNEP